MRNLCLKSDLLLRVFYAFTGSFSCLKLLNYSCYYNHSIWWWTYNSEGSCPVSSHVTVMPSTCRHRLNSCASLSLVTSRCFVPSAPSLLPPQQQPRRALETTQTPGHTNAVPGTRATWKASHRAGYQHHSKCRQVGHQYLIIC